MPANFDIDLKDHDFHRFRKLIYQVAGISLSDRKRELVKARLARRLRALDLASYGDYYDLLQDPFQSGAEIEQFVNALTTNKTEFYREPHHFQYLKEELFPALRMATLSGRDKRVRIWCAASSTGQEPYTLALSLVDYFSSQSDWDLRILASDIDTQVLATAAAGIYPEAELDPVPATLRSKYFTRRGEGDSATYTAKDELKRLITFRQINLNEPSWPINIRFDAIFCRNVMIYFDQATQTKLVEHFVQHLQPEGLLVIGHSESLFSITDEFDSLGETIYRVKREAVQRSMSRRPLSGPVKTLAQSEPQPQTPSPSLPPTTASSTNPTARPGSSAQSESKSRDQARTVVPKSTGQIKPATVDRPVAASSLDHYASWPVSSLIVGEFSATNQACILKTTLGSCIAACLYDCTTGIGGMNHFMLPESKLGGRVNTSYGVHAMELLINAMMNLGANRRKLAAKIFGGAQLMNQLTSMGDVGSRNIQFVREFLETEKIPIVAENVGGTQGRQVHFLPTTAKVFLRLLDSDATASISQTDDRQQSILLENLQSPVTDAVTWFLPTS